MRLATIILFVCLVVPLLAQPVELTTSTQATIFKVQNQKGNTITLQFQLPSVDINKEMIQGKEYTRIEHVDAGYLRQEGMPELPVFSTFVAIPATGNVNVEVIGYTTSSISNSCPIPSQGDVYDDAPAKQVVCDENYYRSTTIYPQTLCQIGEPQTLRDYRIVNVQVQPFAYNPVTNTIEIRNNIELRISSECKTEMTALNPQISRSFEPLYRAMIANYDQIRDESTTYQERSILIIYPSNVSTTFLAKINDLANWKRQKGFTVTLASTTVTGTTNTAIKSYISTAYNTWETKPEYLILVGDGEGTVSLPFWRFSELQGSSNYGEGDYNYTLMGGNSDYIGDLFIGRISIDTEIEFATILAKIKLEERIPNPDLNWYRHILLAGDPSSSGYSCIDLNLYIKELMKRYYPGFVFHQNWSSNGASGYNTVINSGCSWFNYRGYIGMSGWSYNNMDDLTNTNKLVNGSFITCGTGQYANSSESPSERFVRTGSPTQLRGGVTAMGMSTIHTITSYNNCLNIGVFHGLYADGLHDMGQAFLRGKLNLHKNYGVSALIQARTFSQISNLFGDPSMDVWVAPPLAMTTTYPTTIDKGTNYLSFLVKDGNNAPLCDAWVTITQLNNSFSTSGYTDINGQIVLSVNPELNGTIDLVISKPNYVATIGTIEINETQSTVGYASSLVDDDNQGTSEGNNNNIIEAGESIELQIALKNYTTNTLTDVIATLRCTDPNIVLHDSLETYESIPAADSSYFSTGSFCFTVASNCPNQHKVPFYLQTNTNGILHESYFAYQIGGVAIEIVNCSILDNNQILDPAETVPMQFTIANRGVTATPGINALLRTHSSYILITDSLATFSSMNPSEQSTCDTDNFTVLASAQALPGMQVPFDLYLYNGTTLLARESYSLTVGTVTVTSPLGPDNYGYVCYDSNDISYSDCPQYSWVEIAPTAGGPGLSCNIVDNGTTSDHGDNEDSTAVKTIDLPFTFMFYGKPYNQISVCSNGFIAMGKSRINEFRNWVIPGPGGPSPMIAAFWDDLTCIGNSGIYYYFDLNNQYFVVEWNKMKNRFPRDSAPTNHAEETFEVILYNPDYYPTSTGDGPVKVQYKIFNNVDASGYEEHFNYSTIGIEDHTGNVGLQYSFNNAYPTAAHSLSNQSAIYFTPVPFSNILPSLTVQNISILDANNNQVPEAGEICHLGINLKNEGLIGANSIQADLVSTDPYVTVITNHSSYPNIAGNASGFNVQDYMIRISEDCPDNHYLNFTLNINSSSQSWCRNFYIVAHKPSININEVFINDSNGNHDGILEAGETATIIVPITNLQAFSVEDLTAHVMISSPYLTLSDTTFTISRIPAASTLQLPIIVQVSPSAPIYRTIPITTHITGKCETTNYSTLFLGSHSKNIDFETMNSFISNPANVGWDYGSPTSGSHSGSKCMAVSVGDQYLNNSNKYFQTEPFVITENANLRFYHRYSTQMPDDGGNVKISLDNGQSFISISPIIGYPCNNVNALDNSPGFSGILNDWTLVEFDLSTYVNQSAIIRWTFASDNATTDCGWYIDDISINGIATDENILRFTGQITLSTGIEHIHNAEIGTGNIVTNPNAEGDYAFYLCPGNYSVTASLQGYEPAQTQVQIITADVPNIDFTLSYLPAPEQLTGSITENIAHLQWQYIPTTYNTKRSIDRTYRTVFNQYKIYCQTNVGAYVLLDSTTTTQYATTVASGNVYRFYVVACYTDPSAQSVASNMIGLQPEAEPGWVPIQNGDMTTVPCIITFNNEPVAENDIIGAFIKNECRGVSQISITGNQATASLYVFSDTPDTISFKLYQASSQQIFLSNTTIIAIPGSTLPVPLNLNFMPLANNDISSPPLVTLINRIYPNPFNPETNIQFSLAQKTKTSIKVYNIKGQLVKALVNEVMNPGKYSVVWKGTNSTNQPCASGVYFIRLETPNIAKTYKAMLLK